MTVAGPPGPRARTRLTAPEGAVVDGEDEVWTAGFALPVEHPASSRWRRAVLVLLTVLVLVAVAVTGYRLVRDASSFDPGLDDQGPPSEQSDDAAPSQA